MSWDIVLVERLRYVINDLDATAYTWTDLQLQKFLAIAAINVLTDLEKWAAKLNGPYTVNTSVSGPSMITPDPVDNGPMALGNLMVIKAACVIAMSEAKKIGNTAGWKIVDDRSSIDGTKAIDHAFTHKKSICEDYSMALKDYKSGNQFAGYAILSPYQSPNGPFPIRSDLDYNRN